MSEKLEVELTQPGSDHTQARALRQMYHVPSPRIDQIGKDLHREGCGGWISISTEDKNTVDATFSQELLLSAT